MNSPQKILSALVGVSLSLAWSASAADYFNVNFATQSVGDNYTSVAGVGTNTNIVGALPDHITGARAAGDYSLTVDASKRLVYTATGAVNGSEGFQVFSYHGTPSTPETWYVQFDYTRLATSNFIMGVNFLNGSGQNMLGHPNNLTLYKDSYGMSVGTTYTIRIEIDSGTSNCRVYSNGVLLLNNGNPLLTASNTSGGFGGIDFHPINISPTDFNVTNISGGNVTHGISGTVTLGGSGLAGVTVSAGAGHTATTNGSGAYTINAPDAATSYTVTPSLTGYTFTPASLSVTLSGSDVTGKDFAVVTHSISGTVTLGGSGLSGVSVSDGTRTATTNGSGVYTIANVPDAATYTVTPKPTGYTFAPASQSVTLSGSDVTGKDFAVATSDTNYFNVNFATQSVGDNFTSVAGVGTNTNIVGALPDHLTYAASAGDYSLTVDASKRLVFTATGTANQAERFQVFSSHGTPAVPVTWFIQFDYTRLSTSSFIMGMNFFNNVGQNMLGHQNNLTLYNDSIGGDNSYTGAAMTIGSTHTIRIEIDSGTSNSRVYGNGVQLMKAGVPFSLTAVNTSGGFGGINLWPLTNPTDFNVTNISGGTVSAASASTHSISGTVTLGGSGLSGVSVSDGTRTATTNGSGVYTIASVPDAATYTVTPGLTGYTFTPVDLSVTLSGADVTGKDFAVANAFGNWATIHSLSGANALPTANPSHDGLNNLVKYALGLNPAVSAVPPGTHTGNTLTFSKGSMAKADSNIQYSIEESTDLSTWTTPTGTAPSGTVVNGANDITYTYASGQAKRFARLKVVQIP